MRARECPSGPGQGAARRRTRGKANVHACLVKKRMRRRDSRQRPTRPPRMRPVSQRGSAPPSVVSQSDATEADCDSEGCAQAQPRLGRFPVSHQRGEEQQATVIHNHVNVYGGDGRGWESHPPRGRHGCGGRWEEGAYHYGGPPPPWAGGLPPWAMFGGPAWGYGTCPLRGWCGPPVGLGYGSCAVPCLTGAAPACGPACGPALPACG